MMKPFIVLVRTHILQGIIPRHGLVHKKNFTYEQISDNSLAFSIPGNCETLTNYPYDFELRIVYTFG